METPLILKLRKQAYKDTARAQDIIIEELYKVFDKAVLHGGTAIWRCYNGNRFSEDIDVYIPKNEKKINILFEKFKERGFTIIKKKISRVSLFSKIKLNRTIVRFEASFKKPIPKGSLKEYKKINGELFTVYTITPEEIIKEKIDACLKRRKIRDIYDVFFLLRYVKDKKVISKELKELIAKYKKPADEKELKILIIEGLVPSVEKLLEYIKEEIRS